MNDKQILRELARMDEMELVRFNASKLPGEQGQRIARLMGIAIAHVRQQIREAMKASSAAEDQLTG